ncbi:carbohydrate kinase [Cellulosimicrobium cellulans]|uniref:PfkB family carbohydrate kinase n=1 Tax=Cellulosimicrobium cellulans TaxID=1710 RepID=UPI001EDB1A69|nr:PfkB family carbohydrate kinase [Cellulosimicrobium cellulans]UKJ64853.1 carbohydrate kinase [Cellulosimicrobium cellulans]
MSELTAPKVVGTGLLALDLVISADPSRPIQSWAGGTCGNVLSILAYLGWSSYPIARLDHDAAARRVSADLERWGVHLDYVHSEPTTSTPIIIQENRVSSTGVPKHKFTWTCPRCGTWLPSFRPITRAAIDAVGDLVDDADVFFLDRLSRAALTLAHRAAKSGALVVFEPSGRSDPKLFAEAIQIAHIVKYADQRLSDAGGTMATDTATLLEVQTLGSRGLRYRHKFQGTATGWRELEAVPAGEIVDTCGSGDWCTAGLLTKLARGGLAGFAELTSEDVAEGLQHGQELAAWNCRFEGARGGMYGEVDVVVGGATDLAHDAAIVPELSPAVECPACSVP